MYAQPLNPTSPEVDMDGSISWWDSDSECTLVVARPSDEPALWAEYLDGAQRSYRRHGVECALDVETVWRAEDTALFFAALDSGGTILAGVRAKGPLRGPDDSHAVVEWAGRPGLREVRKMITDRVPFGILEMKSAWVTDRRERSRSLTKVIARSGFHAMALMDIQFCMATAGAYVLDRWRSSGGVVAEHIPATPYPDERYETRMMWWDRRTFIQHAEAEQVTKILQESMLLRTRAHAGTAAAGWTTVEEVLA
ncbi:hypothetical protein [Mycolicibacterium palauense]|uniref:hypothetical protein n=1 Tax=Mycolicibacterium palauense TaxID=2034511 RepID=UPI000BFF07B8|nr:hypothetical protein [Mycolicibacterium palauense]